ncbi:MAG: phospho-sugar mutase [Eubacteriales bacterium]
METYQTWLDSAALIQAEKAEILALDDSQRYEAFYTGLSFGTAGIRGTLGVGTNKFNRFVVGQTTQALADIIKTMDGEKIVIIGYDSRNFSIEFSRLCAEILASNGIKAYIFEELCPTPLVSFAIRHYGAIAGINITASHNPKEYNGYKVYMKNGAQLDNDMADDIAARCKELDILGQYNTTTFAEGVESGIIKLLGDETNAEFMKVSLAQTTDVLCDDFSVVYSPLFGTGRILAPLALKEVGVKNVYLVEEQMVVDGNFPGLPKGPNPEEMGSYVAALAIAQEKNADLMVVTDPDADRIGVRARNKDGEFVHLTGNMTGCLLVDYIIRRGGLPVSPMVVKSIVTSQMVDFICKAHNIPCYSTFTGFRFIAELIDSKPEETAIIGLEESYGYLVGDFARDKDAITATALVCQMAMFYKNQGKTLIDALEDLYKTYGFNLEETISVSLPGSEGAGKIKAIMAKLRDEPIGEICDTKVKQIRYFKDGYIYDFEKWTKMDMEGSDVVIFDMADDTQFIIRPSGTEPKVKVYILTKADTMEGAQAKVEAYRAFSAAMFA